MSRASIERPDEHLRPSQAVRSRIDVQRGREQVRRSEIIAAHGSLERYLSRLILIDVDRPGAPELRGFYGLYEAAFPLAEEQETPAGFETVLAFNREESVQRAYGPFYEAVTIVREVETSAIVGAINYAIMSYRSDQGRGVGYDGSAQLNFICVDMEHRGLGIAEVLLRHLEHKTAEIVCAATGRSSPRLFVTCEMNAPERMSAEQVETDAAAALIDPAQRTRWWSNRGFGRLDFPYAQPPLSPQHTACDYLDLLVRVEGSDFVGGDTFPTGPLLEHLRRFFVLSVGKLEGDMAANATWQAQRAYLADRHRIPIRPLIAAI